MGKITHAGVQHLLNRLLIITLEPLTPTSQRWLRGSEDEAKVRRKSVRSRRSPDLEQIALRTQSH